MRAFVIMAAGVVLCAAAPLDMPDPATTPGAINPAITQDTIGQTICNPAWSTKSIRPPVSYTTGLKRSQLTDPRYTDKTLADYEEDHLISLEIGGSPTDPRNLWPELWDGPCGAHVKDRLENALHRLVCAGTITLWQAQTEIAGDWETSYRERIGPLECGHP